MQNNSAGSSGVINIYLAGPGNVGSAVIDLLEKRTAENETPPLKLTGIASRDKTLIDLKGIQYKDWRRKLQASAGNPGISSFIDLMKNHHTGASVLVDATPGSDIIPFYNEVLEAGISLVTPNKKAASGSYQNFSGLKETALKHKAGFGYSTNVGAGLPLIQIIRELRAGSDRIEKIEAVLSGSINFIFNMFNGGMKFSAAVELARLKGYTEPDPRDDLGGIDAARKILILIREAGIQMELEEVEIENLLKFNTGNLKADLTAADEYYETLRSENLKQNKRFAYIARYSYGKAAAALESIDSSNPFAGLSGSENMMAVYTAVYSEYPLIIRGPGAGAAVTAGGIISDIIKIYNRVW